MDHKTMARGCPWKVMGRRKWHCKALVGQPNGSHCDESNCGGLHIADLLISEFREEVYKILGGDHEDTASTASTAEGNES